ncbi:bifunctional DNase/RNase [Symbiobacterium terraclitae]|uniref:Bifunctional DNase/RNase n=1 Tax=Symbiobacterium terraclitae TaxID=557451 RepID=A0ABS4JTV5_9FIRM|nr:bifunctional nuclease family protein [Symbiobacterium terraclitae]MBP2018316.1 bifunctional DNase/RNase [Symbiobacterium terraclitae]
MVGVDLVSVGVVEETASVILVLRAAALGRLLVMEVGLMEGRAIALEAEGVRTPRPLTHELTHRVMEALGGTLTRVVICDYRDRTFFADLELLTAEGREVLVDARPSDAIALALRAGVPIVAEEAVLEAAGVPEEELEEELEEEEATPDGAEKEDDGEKGPVLH